MKQESKQWSYSPVYDAMANKQGVIRVVVFNATFNNISFISWRSVSLMEYQEKTTDLSQVTDKLYHIYVVSSTPLMNRV